MLPKIIVPTLLRTASGCTALLWALTFSVSAAVINPSDLIDNRYLVIQASTQADQIVPDPKGSVVKDIVTGLEWQRCSVGQIWNSVTSACDGTASSYTWESARGLTAAGGFGAPSIEQLRSLVYCSSREGDKYGKPQDNTPCPSSSTRPTINQIAFSNTPSVFYWSSSPSAGNNYAWSLNFSHGGSSPNDKGYGDRVRLVRAGQTLLVPLTVTQPTGGRITDANGVIACSATENSCTAQVLKSAELTLTATPTAGYSFSQWQGCTSTNGNQCSVTMGQAQQVSAIFTAQSYTLSFNGNGGSAVTPITANFGSTITAPADPTREGYTFAGWTPALPNTMPASNTTLTAQWTVNPYTISFNSDGGSAVTPITANFGSTITAPADPTREGYTFAGWTPALPNTMPASNATLTAQWTVNPYTISFNSDGGSAVTPITADFGSAITAPADPTREGYTFAGWTPAVPNTMPASNTTLTAQWTVNPYTISFNSDGGSAVAPITADFGSNITAPADPTREGYDFIAWLPGLPSTMPSQNLQLTAQWERSIATVTAALNGEGSITPASQTIVIGQEASFDLSVAEDAYVAISGSCGAVRVGNTIRTAAIKQDCDIALTVHARVVSDVEQSGPISSQEPVTFSLSGGAGEAQLTAISQLRSGEIQAIDEQVFSTLLTKTAEGEYIFSAEKTGRYELTFIDSVSGEKVTLTFDVLPLVAFSASSQPITINQPSTLHIWLSDEPIEYPVSVVVRSNEGELKLVTFRAEDRLDPSMYRKVIAVNGVTENSEWLLQETDLIGAQIGTPNRHRLVVELTPIRLKLAAEAMQAGQTRLVISKTEGPVTITAHDQDSNDVEWSWESETVDVNAQSAIATFDPSNLSVGRHFVSVKASAGNRQGELELAFDVIASCPTGLTCSEVDKSGIPASRNPHNQSPNRLPLCPESNEANRVAECEGQSGLTAEVPNQYQLTLGLYSAQKSWETGQFGLALARDTKMQDNGREQVGFIVNMDVIGLPNPGESVPVAIPLPKGTKIAEGAVWRKLIQGEWQDFVQNENNHIDSATRNVLGNCPGVSANDWKTGLNVGDECIRLTIEDGGPNDDDQTVNGVIRDPGVLSQLAAFNLSFDSNGGTAVSAQTLLFGSDVNVVDPVREGYTFIGWDRALPATMPAEDLHLTAQWQLNLYPLRLKGVDADSMRETLVAFGSPIVIETPTRAGYTFKGWSPAVPQTMPAGAVELTAQWYASEATSSSAGGSLGWFSALLLALVSIARGVWPRRHRVLAGLLLLALPASVNAKEWFVEVGYGQAQSKDVASAPSAINAELTAPASATVLNNRDDAYRVMFGVALRPQWYLEAGWTDLGEISIGYQQLPEGISGRELAKLQPQRGQGIELATRWYFSEESRWRPYVRTGVLFNLENYKLEWANDKQVWNNQRERNWLLGAGLDYALNEAFSLGASVSYYTTQHAETHLFSAGINYRF
ncbi:InlB B-repeat-containing protein, partial [Vibrio cholerae]